METPLEETRPQPGSSMNLLKLYTHEKKSWSMKTGQVKDSAGRVYQINSVTGSVTRVYPQRPWRGKSERRQVIRQRRLEAVA